MRKKIDLFSDSLVFLLLSNRFVNFAVVVTFGAAMIYNFDLRFVCRLRLQ